MWIGLCDRKGDPFHPDVLSRVDGDQIRWRLDASKEGWLMLENVQPLLFHVWDHIEGQPHYYAFFRDKRDVEPFYPLLKLIPSDHWKPVERGSIMELAAGQLRGRIPHPKYAPGDA